MSSSNEKVPPADTLDGKSPAAIVIEDDGVEEEEVEEEEVEEELVSGTAMRFTQPEKGMEGPPSLPGNSEPDDDEDDEDYQEENEDEDDEGDEGEEEEEEDVEDDDYEKESSSAIEDEDEDEDMEREELRSSDEEDDDEAEKSRAEEPTSQEDAVENSAQKGKQSPGRGRKRKGKEREIEMPAEVPAELLEIENKLEALRERVPLNRTNIKTMLHATMKMLSEPETLIGRSKPELRKSTVDQRGKSFSPPTVARFDTPKVSPIAADPLHSPPSLTHMSSPSMFLERSLDRSFSPHFEDLARQEPNNLMVLAKISEAVLSPSVNMESGQFVELNSSLMLDIAAAQEDDEDDEDYNPETGSVGLGDSSPFDLLFDFPDDETIANRTRNKQALTHTSIEDLEAGLNDPLSEEENNDDDYQQFLLDLQANTPAPLSDEEQNDPDYNFMEDRSEFDAEEFRSDKSVQVTTKEIESLAKSPQKKPFGFGSKDKTNAANFTITQVETTRALVQQYFQLLVESFALGRTLDEGRALSELALNQMEELEKYKNDSPVVNRDNDPLHKSVYGIPDLDGAIDYFKHLGPRTPCPRFNSKILSFKGKNRFVTFDAEGCKQDGLPVPTEYDMLVNRFAADFQNDWKLVIIPDHRERRWSSFEDSLLALGLNRFGKGRWEEISNFYLPSKSAHQLSVRFKNLVSSRSSNNLIKDYYSAVAIPLTDKDVENLRLAAVEHKNNFRVISALKFPNCTPSELRRTHRLATKEGKPAGRVRSREKAQSSVESPASQPAVAPPKLKKAGDPPPSISTEDDNFAPPNADNDFEVEQLSSSEFEEDELLSSTSESSFEVEGVISDEEVEVRVITEQQPPEKTNPPEKTWEGDDPKLLKAAKITQDPQALYATLAQQNPGWDKTAEEIEARLEYLVTLIREHKKEAPPS